MLYQTLNQPKLLIIFLLAGIIGGLIFDVGNFIKFLFSNKKIPSVIIDFIQTSICLVMIFIINIRCNYGIIRIYPYLCFLLTFIIERLTIGKLIAKIYFACYNLIIKINKRIWRRNTNAKTNKND